MVAKIIQVGVGGFGTWHLTNIRRLQESGQIKAGTAVAPPDAPLFDTLTEALAAVGVPDVVVAPVPIHLHAAIASEALRAGADVLLEKPPFARMADYDELIKLEQETGRSVQIGFQSLGSLAIDAFVSGQIDIGSIRSVRVMGNWLRRKQYWSRSPWVGRRSIGDFDVMDGVTTNALAHAIITGMRVAGIQRTDEIKKVEVEMYRANAIDADDTTSLRVTPVDGPIVTAGLTLCAGEQTSPIVEVVGERGTATFKYVFDDVTIQTANGETTEHFGRLDLLENLLAHRKDGTALLVPLWSTGAFMRVVEAIRTAGEPVHIERKWVEKRDVEEAGVTTVPAPFAATGEHPVVQDVEKWIRAAADIDGLFSEAGVPWAFKGRDAEIARAELDNHTLFTIFDGGGTTPSSSPRPYIHPIRTLKGVEVTATRPSDHDWHTGLGFTVPDVNGYSFWGGGTYVHGRGYVVLDDHGTMTTDRIEHVPASASKRSGPAGIDHKLSWIDRTGQRLISEQRAIRWTHLPNNSAAGWALSFRSTLTAVNGPLSLGSPGTNGRVNAGYGGFFWRLPRCTDITILSPTEEGEDNVHGSISPWMAWSARFEGRPGACGDATLVVIPDDKVSAADPWIVRSTAYPGIGSAVAWKDRVEIKHEQTISRGFRIGVVDGKLDREGAAGVADALMGLEM